MPDSQLVFAGTYTSGEYRPGVLARGIARLRAFTTRGGGIGRFRFDSTTGVLKPLGAPTAAENPSWLARHPRLPVLYAVSESAPGRITAFSIDPQGSLTPIGAQPSHGVAPCHLALDKHGDWLVASNYWSGTVSLFRIAADGSLDPATYVAQHAGAGPSSRQTGPHPHCARIDADHHRILVADLGADEVLVYGLDRLAGRLQRNDAGSLALPAGHGPRYLDFHPDGRHVFLLNELASTLVALRYDPERGRLDVIQTLSTLPHAWSGSSTASHVEVHPSGRFVYASNRGHDSIAVFSVDALRSLSLLGFEPTRGRTPRAFAIDPTGRFLLAANQHSGEVVTFSIDAGAGTLEEVARAQVASCVCLVIGCFPSQP